MGSWALCLASISTQTPKQPTLHAITSKVRGRVRVKCSSRHHPLTTLESALPACAKSFAHPPLSPKAKTFILKKINTHNFKCRAQPVLYIILYGHPLPSAFAWGLRGSSPTPLWMDVFSYSQSVLAAWLGACLLEHCHRTSSHLLSVACQREGTWPCSLRTECRYLGFSYVVKEDLRGKISLAPTFPSEHMQLYKDWALLQWDMSLISLRQRKDCT